MDNVELLKEIVGKYSLLFFFISFCFVLLWVYRPGTKKEYRDTAEIPFRHENKPVLDKEEVQK